MKIPKYQNCLYLFKKIKKNIFTYITIDLT